MFMARMRSLVRIAIDVTRRSGSEVMARLRIAEAVDPENVRTMTTVCLSRSFWAYSIRPRVC